MGAIASSIRGAHKRSYNVRVPVTYCFAWLLGAHPAIITGPFPAGRHHT
jgi:hypothetical protein